MECKNAKEMRDISLENAKKIVRSKIIEAAETGATAVKISLYREELYIDMPEIVKKCITDLESDGYSVTTNITNFKNDAVISSYCYLMVNWKHPQK